MLSIVAVFQRSIMVIISATSAEISTTLAEKKFLEPLT